MRTFTMNTTATTSQTPIKSRSNWARVWRVIWAATKILFKIIRLFMKSVLYIVRFLLEMLILFTSNDLEYEAYRSRKELRKLNKTVGRISDKIEKIN